MRTLFILACVFFVHGEALEYEVQWENDRVCVSRVVIGPGEEIGAHRDALPQVVVGLKGGTITRLEANGREIDVLFPSGKAVYRPTDPENELHRSVNRSNTPVELLVIQLKKNSND